MLSRQRRNPHRQRTEDSKFDLFSSSHCFFNKQTKINNLTADYPSVGPRWWSFRRNALFREFNTNPLRFTD